MKAARPIDKALALAQLKGLDQSGLARELRVTDQNVTNWKRRGMPATRHKKVAEILGITVDELLDGQPVLSRAPPDHGVAQSMSYQAHTVLPTIRWEDLVDDVQLPDEFSLAAPDDAMAPICRTGRHIVWNRKRPPTPGAGILVRDGQGQHYVRRMHQGREPGSFRAVPLNPAYRELDSIVDALTIVAVWDGLRGGLEDLVG